MDENMKRHDKPAGSSVARSLAAPELNGIGGAQAGTGSAASRKGDVAHTAVETPETREIAADAETSSGGTQRLLLSSGRSPWERRAPNCVTAGF